MLVVWVLRRNVECLPWIPSLDVWVWIYNAMNSFNSAKYSGESKKGYRRALTSPNNFQVIWGSQFDCLGAPLNLYITKYIYTCIQFSIISYISYPYISDSQKLCHKRCQSVLQKLGCIGLDGPVQYCYIRPMDQILPADKWENWHTCIYWLSIIEAVYDFINTDMCSCLCLFPGLKKKKWFSKNWSKTLKNAFNCQDLYHYCDDHAWKIL